MTFKQLQEEQREWVAHNFAGRKPYMPLLGVAEECGELCHAHLKGEQGIRYTPEVVLAKKKDAVGDILIYLADYCSANDIDLEECVTYTWGKVKQRDWIKNPMNANTLVEGSL